MTYIDKIERDSDRKGAPRADRYYSPDVVATIHCKVSCVTRFASRWVWQVAAFANCVGQTRSRLSPCFVDRDSSFIEREGIGAPILRHVIFDTSKYEVVDVWYVLRGRKEELLRKG